jgi:SAM-dependent methyltransferase
MRHLASVQASEGQLVAYDCCVQVQKRQVEASRRLVNRIVGAVLAALYAQCLIGVGIILRLFRRRRPEPLLGRLAELYPAVPEMVIHKAIELASLRQRLLEGRGLDIGCGDGIVGGVLIESAGLKELHGVDISAVDEGAIRARGYAGYTIGDMQALPHEAGSFDYVVGVCVIEHVPDLDAVLREARRVLRPGGRLCFTTPAPAYRDAQLLVRLLRSLGLRRKAALYQDFRDVMAKHHHYLSEEAWRQRLAEKGFEAVEIEPIFSRGQLAIYELMNLWVYVLQFPVYPSLASWTARPGLIRRLLVFAIAEIAAAVVHPLGEAAEATHFSIACRKP